MPQATDLVVKNGAITPADKTFNLLTPAAGDGGIAEWALKEGAISAVFARITAAAVRTGNKSRKLTVKVRLPSSYQDSVTGLTMVNSFCEMNASFTVPDDYPEDKKSDFVAFATNALTTVLLKSMIRDALPAT